MEKVMKAGHELSGGKDRGADPGGCPAKGPGKGRDLVRWDRGQ